MNSAQAWTEKPTPMLKIRVIPCLDVKDGRAGSLVADAAEKCGAQAIVVAGGAKRVNRAGGEGSWEIFAHGGRNPGGLDAIRYAEEVARLGAGEILLTSMDRDGTGDGFVL